MGILVCAHAVVVHGLVEVVLLVMLGVFHSVRRRLMVKLERVQRDRG